MRIKWGGYFELELLRLLDNEVEFRIVKQARELYIRNIFFGRYYRIESMSCPEVQFDKFYVRGNNVNRDRETLWVSREMFPLLVEDLTGFVGCYFSDCTQWTMSPEDEEYNSITWFGWRAFLDRIPRERGLTLEEEFFCR